MSAIKLALVAAGLWVLGAALIAVAAGAYDYGGGQTSQTGAALIAFGVVVGGGALVGGLVALIEFLGEVTDW